MVEIPVSPIKKPLARAKRKPSPYALFTQQQMSTDRCRQIPHKQRFAYIASLWKKRKE